MIIYGWLGAHKFYGKGEQKTTVWSYPRPQVNDLHLTMKPIPLIKNAILNSTEPDMVVFDGFAGSGSTLIAAEETGRRAYMIEIDPVYCNIIIQRWCSYTQSTKVVINGKIIDIQ